MKGPGDHVRALARRSFLERVRTLLGAVIPVLLAESSWTRRDDFTGAVRSDLARVDLAKLAHWQDTHLNSLHLRAA